MKSVAKNFRPIDVVGADRIRAATMGLTGVVVASLGLIPVQVLLDEIDDLRGDVVPIERSTDGDAHLVDVETDTDHALDLVERQCRLNGGVAVAARSELDERADSRQRFVQLLRRDALIDVEIADERVREPLDDDTRRGHCNLLSLS